MSKKLNGKINSRNNSVDDLKLRVIKAKKKIGRKQILPIYEFIFGKLSWSDRELLRRVINLRSTNEKMTVNIENLSTKKFLMAII